MEKSDEIKELAFKRIINTYKNRKNIEDVIEGTFAINDESFQYDEIGDIIEREIVGDTRENSAVKLLTLNILQSYKKCKNDFDYEEELMPRRELTNPSEGINIKELGLYNEGRDNIEYNLIVCVKDDIKGPKFTYTIIDLIGQGISGQVFKCQRIEDKKYFAMKIIKNKKAYKNQALIELRILEFLNNEVDKQDLHHIIRLFDHFCYKDHLCIIFELLNENLYELLKQNYFQGISLNSIRFIIKQILEAVYQLQRANLIHCDLKPENILLKIDKDNNRNDVIIKITDFGSACFKNHTMFQYIQSRYYRAPEVLIGGRYGPEIDMWSIGCIAVELFLGEPILPGSSEFDQLGKIIKLTGNPPQYILKEGKNSRKYFSYDSQTKRCRIKTLEEYLKEFPNEAEHKYEIPLDLKNLDELLIKSNKKNLNVNHNLNISSNSLNTSNTNTNFDNSLDSFVNFLKGLLNVDPKLRWNAKQALRHPFITKEKFDGYFNPNAEEISQFLHQSIEASQHSNKTNYYTRKYPNSNSNVYHSIMVCNNNPYMSNNISYNNSISFTNSSLETSCYQLNTNKIPLHIIKNFPYAKIDEINLKPGKQKRKHHNKYDNNTFMKTSYDEINFNNSFTSDHNFYAQKNREIKDYMMTKNKNKFSNFLRTGLIKNKSFGHSNQSNHKIKNNYNRNSGIPKGYNILQINEMHGGPAHIINEGTDKISSTDLIYNNTTKAKAKDKLNLIDYEGLMIQNPYQNSSFDRHNRTRSKSDYNQTNLKSNNNFGKNTFYSLNNLNILNFSNYNLDKEISKKTSPLKHLSSQETPIVNTKIYNMSEEKHKEKDRDKENYSNIEIKEEDINDEELILNLN